MKNFSLYTTVGKTLVNCRKNRELSFILNQAWPEVLKAIKSEQIPLIVKVEKDHFKEIVKSLQSHTRNRFPMEFIEVTINGTTIYHKPVVRIEPGEIKSEVEQEEQQEVKD